MKRNKNTQSNLGIKGEEMLEIFSRYCQDNFFVQDTNLRYQLIHNPQLGWRAEEAVGKTDDELVLPEDARTLTEMKKKVLTTRRSLKVKLPLVTRHGEKEYFDGVFFPRVDKDGSLQGLIGYFRNLTESVRAEKELDLYFEMVPDMIAVATTDGYFKKLNKEWERVLGFDIEELKSKPFAEFIHPEDLEKTRQEINRQLEGKSTKGFINRFLTKDGSWKWLDWSALPSPDGKHLYATARDITEKREMEDRLRESEERFHQVASSSGSWVWEVDTKGKYTYCGDGERTILGYEPDEIVGRKYFYDFFPPDVREQLKKAALEVFAQKLPFENFENPNLHKLGHTVILETRGIPLLDSEGNLVGYRGADIDITIRKRDEEAIQKQANLLEIAHDCIIVRDEESRVTFWNRGAETCYGWSRAEALGQVTHTLLQTRFPVPLKEIDKILQSEGYWEGELTHCRKDGSQVVVSSRWQKRVLRETFEIFEINTDITEKKQIEQAFHEVESNFYNAYYTSPDAIAISRLSDGTYVSVNPGFQQIFGYIPENIIGKRSLDIGILPDVTERDRFVQLLMAQQKVENYEMRVRTVDGTLVDCLISATMLKLNGIDHMLTTTRNISHIKRNQAKLQESERRFRKIYEDGPYCMGLVDKEFKFLMANPRFCSMLGYTEEELKRLSLRDINYKLTNSREAEELQKMMRGEISQYKAEKQYITKDGRIIWAKVTASAYFDEHGEFLYNMAMVEDITEQKNAEQAIQNLYERLDLATRSAGIGIWDWDIINNSIAWDRKMYELYGLPVSEENTVYQNWVNGLHPEDRDEQNAITARAVENQIPYETEFRVVWPDGSIHWLKATGEVFSNQEGKPVRMIGVNYDITRLKTNEEQIRQQNERLDAVIKAIPDLIFVIGKDGRYSEVITSFPEKLLVPVDRIVGSYIGDSFNPEMAGLFMDGIKQALEHRKIVTIKYQLILSIQSESFFEARIAPLNDDQVLVLARDITQESQKEAEIHRLSLAVEQSPVSIVITDLEGNIEYANRAFGESSGFPPHEVIGKNTRILKSGKNPKELYKSLWEKIRSGREWNGELINKKKNGKLYWESISISPIFNSSGEASNYLAVKLDITNRKKSEELLRQNEEKYRFMFINNPQPMWIYDLETLRFIEVNSAAIEHYGYSREEFLKLTLRDILPAEDIAARGEDIKALQNSLNSASEWRHQKKNGEVITVEVSSHGVIYNGRSARHVLVNDITLRKKTENEIRELNAGLEERIKHRTLELAEANMILTKEIEERKKAELELLKARSEAEKTNLAKSDFLSRMSHELRTPMNSILGFAQLMEMGELNSGQRKGVKHILNSGKHLLDLINEILDIARIEAGRLSLSVEPVLVSSMLLEVIDSIHLLAANRMIEITLVSSSSNLLFVKADRQRMKQVLLNLVNNAIKYNREGGSITIESSVNSSPEKEVSMLRISITDTGSGIAEGDIAKLFTPFERIGAEKTLTEGTGLGLAVVQKLMEAMGGSNGVTSVSGEGSTFWIEFPLATGPVEDMAYYDSSSHVIPNLRQRKGTILYIEDNQSNVELIQQVLTDECPGILLYTEEHGKKVVQRAMEHTPDLILLDLNLPDIHGSEVLVNLQENESTRFIPVIVISADAMSSQQKKLLQLGAKKYLTKPLDVSEFLKVIDEFIGS